MRISLIRKTNRIHKLVCKNLSLGLYHTKLKSTNVCATDLLVKNEVNIESTEASLLTKHKVRDDPRLEQKSEDKITPDNSHLHLRSFPSVGQARLQTFIEV